MKTIKIGIIDDHLLFRKGMIVLLQEFEGISVVFDAENGHELLNKLQSHPVDVILLDLDMPVMNGFDAVKVMKEKYPDVKIVILSMHTEDAVVEALLKSGAHGFLMKNQDIEIVVDCIRSIMETGFYFNPEIKEKQVNKLINTQNLFANLESVSFTKREIQVIEQICQLHTNKQIAQNLSLSVRTVDGYIERIFRKTSLKNRTGVVMYAMQHNIFNKKG